MERKVHEFVCDRCGRVDKGTEAKSSAGFGMYMAGLRNPPEKWAVIKVGDTTVHICEEDLNETFRIAWILQKGA